VAGFARRVPDPKDRRSAAVGLLADRAREAGEMFALVQEAGGQLVAGYSDRDLDLIVGYLRSSNDMLREAASSLRSGQAATSAQPEERR
jgi:hypothetical protein